MINRWRTEGFIFKKEDRFESDRIFSVFTKNYGRLEIMGKAIRKMNSKLRSGAEIFSFSNLEFIQGRNQKTLTDAVAKEKFKEIFENPEKLAIAYEISNILDGLIKGQEKDERIFALLKNTFIKLNDSQLPEAKCYLSHNYFFWNFVLLLGYSPEFSSCVVCRGKLDPYNLYFSCKEGGVICSNCFILKGDGIKIGQDLVKILRLILKKDWDIFFKLKVENNLQRSLKEISDSYYNYLKTIYSFKDNFNEI